MLSRPFAAFRVLLPLVLGAVSAAAVEIFSNGSLETTGGAGTLPAGWTAQGTTVGLAVQSSSTHAQAGTWSLRVTRRGDELDGPRQSVTAALNASGRGVRRQCRCWVRLDDVASVRVLLRYGDTSGQKPDVILAEQVVRTPGQWVPVEGWSTITWTGTLQSAAVVLEVLQLSRAAGTLAARLLPDYYVDSFSMDTDADGDGLMDRDEPALGYNPAKADTDGDGLPDRWEGDHAFSASANEAALDSDADGFTNLQEYWAATDPRSASSYPGKPANPNSNAAARKALQWLALLPSQAPGRHLAVGQTVTDLGSPADYTAMIDRLGTTTGKLPAILSMAIEPPFDRFGIPLQMAEAERRALAYWQAGGLVLMKWAIYNPWTGKNGNDQTGVDLPGLLNPAVSAASALAANQAAHDRLLGWMATVADALARLQQQGVVVMFRPCSEMNGSWFWWGRRERSEYAALWRFLYDYFTMTRGLNNLLWVYESDAGTHAPSAVGGQGFASDYYYPGDDVVDVMTHNFYSGTWVPDFNANEIYRRYPKVYGIPQAGPDQLSRDGTFDNLTYVAQTEALLPRSSFFIVWNSFDGTDPVTQVQSYRRLAIVDNANAPALMQHASVFTRETLPASLFTLLPPGITTPPAARSAATGASATFTAVATGTAPLAYQWLFNGRVISGATTSTYSTGPTSAGSAGLYSVRVTDAAGATTSDPAILGVAITGRIAGSASEVSPNVVHPNGNTYDQMLLEGTSASVTADPGQVLRLSFIDLTDDIVQVEFAGAGTLSVSLASATGPAAPVKYNQSVAYLRGHASLVVSGADETTHLSVFSVGRATAVNQALFRSDVSYDGVADLAFIAIQSANGKFGGLRTANASYFATNGITGVYAPGVQFAGPVYVGDINASDAASPVLVLGSASDVRITGGDLTQANGRPVVVSGIAQLQFTAGTNSHGTLLPVQANRARLEAAGVDVTTALVAYPSP